MEGGGEGKRERGNRREEEEGGKGVWMGKKVKEERNDEVFILWYRIESESLDDGHHYSPKSLFSWLTRVMYNRRTRINPLWNTVLIGGYEEQTP